MCLQHRVQQSGRFMSCEICTPLTRFSCSPCVFPVMQGSGVQSRCVDHKSLNVTQNVHLVTESVAVGRMFESCVWVFKQYTWQ